MKLGMAKSAGRTFLAASVDDAIVDMSATITVPTLFDLIAAWPEWGPKVPAAIAAAPKAPGAIWQAPIPLPPKFLLLAGNFRAHVVESGFAPVPVGNLTPQFFIKPPTTIIGPSDVIPLTRTNRGLDYEAELAVIIGAKTKNATLENAMNAVWGYTVVNDISERKLNEGVPDRHKRSNDDFYDWLVGKWFDGSAPMGPFAITADELPSDPSVTAHLNGEIVQDSPISVMIHTVAEAIVYISSILTLEPGDVISMGTPSGVGMARGRLLQDGDIIECSVSGIGTLRNRVEAE
jgi:2-keto-4-pentenoate hydratase/2-oxohepta-3-ene-1,7-dioic acid hydratase in catechol pathway